MKSTNFLRIKDNAFLAIQSILHYTFSVRLMKLPRILLNNIVKQKSIIKRVHLVDECTLLCRTTTELVVSQL